MPRATLVLILVIAVAAGAVLSAEACTRTTRLVVADMIADTEIIVRARAVGYGPDTTSVFCYVPFEHLKPVEFRVYEVLKGDDVPERLYLVGHLGDSDEYNDGDVPYTFVRSSGRHGMCHTSYYCRGAQYLLFLGKVEGRYRVIGEALAPVNEQVTGAQDPWVLWVKAFVGGMRYQQRRNE